MKNKWNLLICIASAVILATYIFVVDGPENILLTLKSVNLSWLFLGIGCMVLYWLLEAVILHMILRKLNPSQAFFSTFRVSMIGQYFNTITPFASGGQPFQAYYLTKQGVSLDKGITGLLTKFIVYQGSLTLLSIIVLVFRLHFFQTEVNNFIYVTLIGFAVNFAVMFLLICVTFWPKPTKAAAHFGIRLLGKMHILKNPERQHERVEAELDKFYRNNDFMAHNVFLIFKAVLLSIMQILSYLMVSYMVYRAFGLTGADLFTMIAASAFVMMIASFVPLPGAAGASEGSFYLFFSIFFPAGLIHFAVLFWRMITFYLTIVVGAFFSIGNGKVPTKVSPTGE